MRFALELASTVVFAAHLLAVNLAMAGPILCIWLERRDRRADPAQPGLERALAAWSLTALLVGLALGAGLLGLLWLAGEKAYFAALAMIPRDRLAFGAAELVFYFVVMFAYQTLRRTSPRRRWLSRLLGAAGAANLLAHFPTLFAMMSVLSHRPEMWGRSLDRGLYQSLLVDPEVLSRVVHVWLAAVATAGIFVMLLAARRAPAGEPEGASDEPAAGADLALSRAPTRPADPGRALVVGGALWALAASLAQLPVGLWALVAMPAGAQAAWSGDMAGLALLGAGVLAALKLVQQLATAALGDAPRPAVLRSAAMLVLTVLLMCGASRHLRHAANAPLEGAAESRAAVKAVKRDSLPTPAAGAAPVSSACQSTVAALP